MGEVKLTENERRVLSWVAFRGSWPDSWGGVEHAERRERLLGPGLVEWTEKDGRYVPRLTTAGRAALAGEETTR